VNEDQRALLGVSLGGFFVGYALLVDNIDKPHFKIYASFDAPFQIGKKQFQQLNEIRYKLSGNMNAILFLTGTNKGNEKNVRRFQKMLDNKYKGLNILKKRYGVKHEDIAMPSFKDMIEALY